MVNITILLPLVIQGYKISFSPWVYASSIDAVHISLVYHFGTKLANRYKNRNLIDNDYRLAVEKEKIRRDSVHTAQVKEKRITYGFAC